MRPISWLLVLLLAVSIINYPNPFNPKGGEIATIECTADSSAEAFLYIYDMAARFVLRKAFDLEGGAVSRVTWDGYSEYNELAGNGIYFYFVLDKANNRIGKGKIWIINR